MKWLTKLFKSKPKTDDELQAELRALVERLIVDPAATIQTWIETRN